MKTLTQTQTFVNTITVTMTAEQHTLFLEAMDKAKARDLAIAEWTGETVDEIEARYQFPHDDILEDMALAAAGNQIGFSMF